MPMADGWRGRPPPALIASGVVQIKGRAKGGRYQPDADRPRLAPGASAEARVRPSCPGAACEAASTRNVLEANEIKVLPAQSLARSIVRSLLAELLGERGHFLNQPGVIAG